MPLIVESRLITSAFVGSLPVTAIMNSGIDLLSWIGSYPGISDSTVYSPLISSLILTRGTGDPTYSRATATWRLNELGLLQSVASGCAVFGGARLVRNLCPTPSNTLAVSGTKTVTLTAAATLQFSMGAGTGTATFSGTGGATGTLAASSSRVSVNKTVTAGTFIVTVSVSTLTDLSITDVTNYSASYTPEYVSVGVESAPFFGAGIDGAKYFQTDQYGAPLYASSLLGFWKGTAATNNLLCSRDFAGRLATALYLNTAKCWIPSVTGSTLVTNGTFDSDVTGWTAEKSTITFSSGKLRVVTTALGGWASQTLTLVVGKTYLITASSSIIVGGINDGSIRIHPDNSSASIPTKIQFTVTGGTETQALIFTATDTSQLLLVQNSPNSTIEYDDIVVKECSCAPTLTATGLDGIANTATTLTFIEANATILQPISLSSAARCASAWVRRKTGTGAISFTQDGGSTWTDITSQLYGGIYSRVQITATLANPSVGFRGAVAGDVIEVDVVMNEAGTVASPPIITTTAAVTVNADSLTYQTASNWSDTAGTAYIEAEPLAWSGGAIGSATNGLLLSAANSGATGYDGTNAASGPTGTPGTKEKLVLRWNASEMDVASSGAIGTVGVYDGGMGLSSIGVGVGARGYFRKLTIYDAKLSDTISREIVT